MAMGFPGYPKEIINSSNTNKDLRTYLPFLADSESHNG
jgi:hypothetical protein